MAQLGMLRDATGDLALVNGTTKHVEGAAYATQRIDVSLDIFLGEYFLDLKEGVAYFRDVLVHDPDAEVVKSVFRQRILQTPGIVDVTEITVALDPHVTNKAVVEFTALYEDGTIIPVS